VALAGSVRTWTECWSLCDGRGLGLCVHQRRPHRTLKPCSSHARGFQFGDGQYFQIRAFDSRIDLDSLQVYCSTISKISLLKMSSLSQGEPPKLQRSQTVARPLNYTRIRILLAKLMHGQAHGLHHSSPGKIGTRTRKIGAPVHSAMNILVTDLLYPIFVIKDASPLLRGTQNRPGGSCRLKIS
jgi:hypothetical protein